MIDHSNVTTTPAHTLPGLDSVRPPESSGSLMETIGAAEAAAETSEVATPTYTTNLTTAVRALTLSGRDSLTGTTGGVASKVATPNYSKRLSDKFPPPLTYVSILPDLC
jgi:hypothetical protein